MIITCASCLTKFNLDDSRISAKGVKVRCSRCQHVFYVVPPPETKEEVIENFETFAKYHGELMEPGEKETGVPSSVEEGKRETMFKEEEEEEERFLFSEKGPTKKAEPIAPIERPAVETAEVKAIKTKRMMEEEMGVQRERRGPSRFFALIIILILLVFAIFYISTELGSGGKLSPYLETPIKKITDLWDRIWGIKKEGLIVRDLGGYEEKVGEVPLFIIEGKVDNQSQLSKKHIKLRVVIYDQNKAKVAEKETVCGRIMSREELKSLPPDFLKGEMTIKPQIEREMIASFGKTIPFMVIFRDLPPQAKEFKVEIIDAPNL
jgi:predicted Zn finger-like uncharacterized protein